MPPSAHPLAIIHDFDRLDKHQTLHIVIEALYGLRHALITDAGWVRAQANLMRGQRHEDQFFNCP